jgi:hypothetical protein
MNLRVPSLIFNDFCILGFKGAMREKKSGEISFCNGARLCRPDQPQQVDMRNSAGTREPAAAGRADTAALRIKMNYSNYSQPQHGEIGLRVSALFRFSGVGFRASRRCPGSGQATDLHSRAASSSHFGSRTWRESAKAGTPNDFGQQLAGFSVPPSGDRGQTENCWRAAWRLASARSTR